jgi:hypothetical protein
MSRVRCGPWGAVRYWRHLPVDRPTLYRSGLRIVHGHDVAGSRCAPRRARTPPANSRHCRSARAGFHGAHGRRTDSYSDLARTGCAGLTNRGRDSTHRYADPDPDPDPDPDRHSHAPSNRPAVAHPDSHGDSRPRPDTDGDPARAADRATGADSCRHAIGSGGVAGAVPGAVNGEPGADRPRPDRSAATR